LLRTSPRELFHLMIADAVAGYCFRELVLPHRMTASATFRILAQGDLDARRDARFCGGLPAAAEVAHAAPVTALKPEGSCRARLRRCRDCPRGVAAGRGGHLEMVGSFPGRPVASRRPPASLLRLEEQAPATVESALMQLVRWGSAAP
jgi:hypothetical protein